MASAKEVWHSSREELERVKGITSKICNRIIEERKNVDVYGGWQEIKAKGIQVITYEDEDYPESLKHIHAPPALLYVKGAALFEKHPRIAVVGTRKCTPYGKKIAVEVSQTLAEQGFTVVSGMARGIDTLAHLSCLKAGGRTIAVLGSGLDVIYPRENESLSKKIVENGALVSEFPLGTKPLPRNFPMRNRIISGLSLGVVVVESAHKSGALITADCALEQGREVFAVPGNIDSPYSRGCNRLIKQGAVLLDSPIDILQELGYDVIYESEEQENVCLTLQEEELLRFLTSQPIHVDSLREQCGLSSRQLNALLTLLELKKIIKQFPGKYFVRI
ncbi:DNA-processing protein DprA [Candidatus Contubernalis alkaliaceticus]|uniref:DNA-processing protein DprA n=1 Tax=Candidatus Contubernalis alkaliaceticus TaxID=338645 RepID=UPI001F4C2F7B|nr:DNA-processing protein DprA [Candidatus Contubernalis alkalaceticus]UNC91817.1 DNA-protecting protein DprA [Candidatus Contubernalis alkalaceticus]